MLDKNKQPKTPNNPIVWVLILTLLFSATVLLWLKSDSIQEAGQNIRMQSQADKNSATSSLVVSSKETIESSKQMEPTVKTQTTPQASPPSTEEMDLESTVTTIESSEMLETSKSFEQAYAELPEAKTYSIYQFQNNEIQDRFVNRAFEVMIQRLIDEDNFFSTIDYQITIYPTLDDNIYNLGLAEKYADQLIAQGHYRFDYRGKKVTKY